MLTLEQLIFCPYGVPYIGDAFKVLEGKVNSLHRIIRNNYVMAKVIEKLRSFLNFFKFFKFFRKLID
jgi:hypothetical protein